MKTTNLTKQEIREKGLKEYFKVVLFDEDCFEIEKTIGRFETLKEAKFEAKRFYEEKLDGAYYRVDILRFWYDEVHMKYKFDVDGEYVFWK